MSDHFSMKALSDAPMIGHVLICERQNMTSRIYHYVYCYAIVYGGVGVIL